MIKNWLFKLESMPLRKKVRLGYYVALALLMICYFFIFQSAWNLQKEYDRIMNSYKAEHGVEKLKTSVIEAETSIRGYYITKEESYLSAYDQQQQIIPVIYDELRMLEAKNPPQLAMLDSIKSLIDLRLALMKRNLGLFNSAGKKSTPEIETTGARGQAILDSIKNYSQHFIAAEEKLMSQRKEKLTGFFSATLIITLASLITAILSIIYSLYTYNKESAARDASTRKNIQYQRELENNIAELKRMDAEVTELRSLEKFTATGRVARTIAHEVRNPLTNISLATEQLKESSDSNEDSSLLLEMISRNTVRINQLVLDLLNATKSIQLNMQKVDINNILDEAIQMASDRIELKQIKVEKNYGKELCHVSIDAERMKIALLNIIINAVEAMEKGKGILQVRTSSQKNKCIIEIIDNGIGMDQDTLQKMFEPYFSNKPNGSGLGLTNTQNIIMTHKGKITIQSEPGKGTHFVIALDLAG